MSSEKLIQNGKLRINVNDLFALSMCIYFICMPLGAMGFKNIGSVLRYIALLPLAIFIFTKNKKINLNKMLVSKTILIIWFVLSLIWTINFNSTKSNIIRHLFFFILVFVCSANKYEEKHIKWFKTCLIWSSRITAILLIFFGTDLNYQGRITLKGIIVEDPNYLCGYFIFGVIAAVDVILSNTKTSKKFVACIELLAYAYSTLITGSRGGTIAILVSIFIFFLMENNNKRNIRKVLLLLLGMCGVYIIMRYLSTDLLKRFTVEDVIETKGTSRFVLWENALHIFNDSNLFEKLFGYGFGTIIPLFASNGCIESVSHNVFIDYLLEVGILGLLIYVYYLCTNLFSTLKNKNAFSCSVLFGMIALSISTSITTFKPYWNILLFIICESLVIKENNIKTIENI